MLVVLRLHHASRRSNFHAIGCAPRMEGSLENTDRIPITVIRISDTEIRTHEQSSLSHQKIQDMVWSFLPPITSFIGGKAWGIIKLYAVIFRIICHRVFNIICHPAYTVPITRLSRAASTTCKVTLDKVLISITRAIWERSR